MDYYTQAWKQYFDFSGRTNRKAFWMFVLFNIIISFVIGIVSSFLHIKMLSGIYNLLILIPSIAISVRRLRDAGFNPWWAIVYIVPIIGFIIVLIMNAFPTKSENPNQSANTNETMPTPPSPSSTPSSSSTSSAV